MKGIGIFYPVMNPSPVMGTGGVSNINLDTFKKHKGPLDGPVLMMYHQDQISLAIIISTL